MVAITELGKGKSGVGWRVEDDPAYAGWVAKANPPALSTALEKKGALRWRLSDWEHEFFMSPRQPLLNRASLHLFGNCPGAGV